MGSPNLLSACKERKGKDQKLIKENSAHLTIKHPSTPLSFPPGIADIHYSQHHCPLKSFICLLSVECAQ